VTVGAAGTGVAVNVLLADTTVAVGVLVGGCGVAVGVSAAPAVGKGVSEEMVGVPVGTTSRVARGFCRTPHAVTNRTSKVTLKVTVFLFI
jgi:hypothetical protein